MYYAREKRSKLEVSASKAVGGRAYVCPNCGEDVIFRDGKSRASHFAHRSGRADPECDLYYPSSGIGNPLPPLAGPTNDPPIKRPSIASLSLGLRVEPLTAATRYDKRRWRLALTIPKSFTTTGRLRVPTGFGPSRELRLLLLSQSPDSIDVNPNAGVFGPEWISDEVDYDYRTAVSKKINGLASDRLYAFVANDSTIKAMTNNLVCGDSYFFVWKRPDIELPEAIADNRLALHEGWSAAHITLPNEALPEIAAWLSQFSDLKMQAAQRQWGIIYPPPIEMNLEGRIVVSEANYIALGFIEGQNSNEDVPQVSITTAVRTVDISTSAGRTYVLEVKRPDIDPKRALRLQWARKQLPGIVAAPRSNLLKELPAVTLVCSEDERGAPKHYSLHNPDGRQALERTRNRQAHIHAIHIPFGVAGTIEQRHQKGSWTQILTLQHNTNVAAARIPWSLNNEQITSFVQALRDTSIDFRVSFGCFGYYIALSNLRVATHVVTLAARIRQQIVWYCRANGVCRTSTRHPIDVADDVELLETFQRTHPRPHMIAHQNMLRKRLAGISRRAA